MNFDILLEEYRQALEWTADTGRPVHLLGIGGVGMAGLALLLKARGFFVSGCDLHENSLVTFLRNRGIAIFGGHDPAHITPETAWAVRSAAVPEDHPEIEAAISAGIPVFRRGTVLPALLRNRRSIAVAGTHGKTTTASFLAQILHASGQPYGYCVGGEVPGLEGVAADGSDNALAPIAAEADESDGTLALYECDTAVVTNIDFDHKENFSGIEEFEDCFQRFIARTVRCLVYAGADTVASRLAAAHPYAVSFGFDRRFDYHAVIVSQSAERTRFKVAIRGCRVGEVDLPATGEHNVLNALAALAAAAENGIDITGIIQTLAGVSRPRRRFETLLDIRERRIVSDYAHHPTEIRALLQSARAREPKRIVTVFQPHRYTRTRALGPAFPAAFEGADPLVLLPVYAASEKPVAGGATLDLYRRFRELHQANVSLADSFTQVEQWLTANTRAGDMILIAGAGDVERIGIRLAQSWRNAPPADPDDAARLHQKMLAATGLPAGRARKTASLAKHTTLGVGGEADIEAMVDSEQELSAILAWAVGEGVPVRVLGGGSNILVSDLGVRGIVIRLTGAVFRHLDILADNRITAGGGTPLSRLAKLGRDGGRFACFAFLSGIPGTIGGGARMNAGAWNRAIGDYIVEVRGFDARGYAWVRQRAELEFGYRECKNLNPGDVITAVTLAANADGTREAVPDTADIFKKRAWMRGKRTAGSVFRNPAHTSAGALLEAADCKGLRIGGAMVCDRHANVIACDGQARASDVSALMEVMRQRAREFDGTILEPEIVVWM